nr:MAG TPA: hypothetical protein [Caudoviricetes sp.]
MTYLCLVGQETLTIKESFCSDQWGKCTGMVSKPIR